MYFNFVVSDKNDCLYEYEFESAMDFCEAYEAENYNLLPEYDSKIVSVDIDEVDCTDSFGMEDLRDRGVVNLNDLYQ